MPTAAARPSPAPRPPPQPTPRPPTARKKRATTPREQMGRLTQQDAQLAQQLAWLQQEASMGSGLGEGEEPSPGGLGKLGGLGVEGSGSCGYTSGGEAAGAAGGAMQGREAGAGVRVGVSRVSLPGVLWGVWGLDWGCSNLSVSFFPNYDRSAIYYLAAKRRRLLVPSPHLPTPMPPPPPFLQMRPTRSGTAWLTAWWRS